MNRLDDLERLGKLRDAGGLTTEDFEREKTAILRGSAAAARTPSNRWSYFILPGAAVTAIAGLLLYQPIETPRQGSPDNASGALAAALAPPASQPVILPQSSPEPAAAPSAEGPFTFPATPGPSC